MSAAPAAQLPTATTKRVIVYAGKHYGQVHRVVALNGRMIQVRHEASGDVIGVHVTCTEDVDYQFQKVSQ